MRAQLRRSIRYLLLGMLGRSSHAMIWWFGGVLLVFACFVVPHISVFSHSCTLVITLSCSFLTHLLASHHGDKLLVVDLSVAVDVGLPDHLVDLLVCQLLA